uniref:Cadherin n=1 Tax=Schistosoma mansoni TaxID=6183 RepID=A0A5K4FE07_SCHMA
MNHMDTIFVTAHSLLRNQDRNNNNNNNNNNNSNNNNNELLIPYYQLNYTITENQPIHYKIGQINKDLLLKIKKINKTMKLLNYLLNQSSPSSPSSSLLLLYKLQTPTNDIDLNETTSELVTKKRFDLEKLCPFYCHSNNFFAELFYHVYIQLNNNQSIISLITIQLLIIDLNDNLPFFPLTIKRPYKIQLKEVIYHKGKLIELPKAIDYDIHPKYNEIDYQLDTMVTKDKLLIMNTFDLLITNDKRLLLLLKIDLDYELMNQYRFYLICKSINDNNNNNSIIDNDQLEMIIDVLNINDNEPKFSQMIYEIKIMENILVNSMIYQLIATDEDVNSTITYSMVNNIDLNLTSKFLIQSNGQIIIKEQLDYEQCNLYSYTIRANDGEFDAFTQLIIKIIDVNDERPEFLLNPSKLIIKENQPEKTFIGHLLIIDRDSPQVNGQVHCEEPSHLIRNQPILFVKESFDLNERILSQNHNDYYYSTIFSTISSTSSSSTSSSSSPSSLLSNTETHVYQRFTLYSQNKYDRENITDKYLAILYCWDGIPNSFSNSLVSLDSTNYLSTDYPKHVSSMTSMSLLSSLTATMTITLQILDENDNEPIFDKPLYKVTFKENSPRNTKIIQMHATDKDIEENAQIYYSLQKNELNTPYFKIDPITGWILNTAEIDREAQSTFKLTILAIDGGYQPLNNQFYLLSNNNTIHHTSTTQLIIHMLDVNDNAPEFYGPRQFAIEENQPSNTWIGDLKVIDKDEGLNSEITLKLLLFSDKWFNENVESQLRNNTTQLITDYHLPFYILNNGMIASDNGQDKVYSTIDTICIRILDLNDNKPYFIGIEGEYYDINKPSMNQSLSTMNSTIMDPYINKPLNTTQIPSIHLSINEKPGYCIFIVKAFDLDEGMNSLLQYNITLEYSRNKAETILDALKMNTSNGQVILNRSLDHNEIGNYKITVIVKDSGIPIIELIIEDTPARGNWLLSNIIQQHNTKQNTIIESYKIFIIILFIGMSTFLATILISIILCMIKPCRRIQMKYSTKWSCKRICNEHKYQNNNNNNGDLRTKELDGTIFNRNADNRKVDHIESINNVYKFDLYNQQCQKQRQQQQQPFDPLSGYTSERNVDNSFDNISLYTTYNQDHYKKLFIVNDCSTIDYIKNDLIPYYGFVETDTYCNGTNTNDQSTCIMNMNANGQELAMNNEIQPVYVERVLLPLNINKNTFQQPEWNSFILEFPQNDCQHILLNTSFDDKHLRCSLHLPQQLNHNTQLCDSSKMSFPSVSLPSSNNSTVKPDLILLQCTNTLPISSSNYVQHHRSVLLNPTSMSNTVILLDPNTPSLKNPKSVNKRNIDCSVQNIITPIASEEQHSDSGRGASDEENSSRIHQH